MIPLVNVCAVALERMVTSLRKQSGIVVKTERLFGVSRHQERRKNGNKSDHGGLCGALSLVSCALCDGPAASAAGRKGSLVVVSLTRESHVGLKGAGLSEEYKWHGFALRIP